MCLGWWSVSGVQWGWLFWEPSFLYVAVPWGCSGCNVQAWSSFLLWQDPVLFPPVPQSSLFYCPWPSDAPDFICGTPPMVHAKYACTDVICLLLFLFCVVWFLPLPGVMARFIFWSSENSAMGLGVAHSPEFATEMFAIWKQNKPLLSGILLSALKAPLSPDFFLYKAVVFKKLHGTKKTVLVDEEVLGPARWSSG